MAFSLEVVIDRLIHLGRVHCRHCWQLTPSLSSHCLTCGRIDRLRRLQGLGLLAIYLALGAGIFGVLARMVLALRA